ncbi:hypothetical protein BKA70DRAFT_1437591 [Coprinopsis sp. MPI-PUGE-AT-0042]|nr:hypothetical protein BKA70DRAFT_1437591 [Coprinopsis sp. MPI-PUGE-AT-0042]
MYSSIVTLLSRTLPSSATTDHPCFSTQRTSLPILHLILDDIHFLGDEPESFSLAPPTLLSVESLVVKSMCTIRILNYLTLPSLKSLRLVEIVNLQGRVHLCALGMLMAFVERSQLHLDTASLDQDRVGSDIQGLVIGGFKHCRLLQIVSLEFAKLLIHLPLRSAWSSGSLKALVCTKPIFDIIDGRATRALPDEFINRQPARPLSQTLTMGAFVVLLGPTIATLLYQSTVN